MARSKKDLYEWEKVMDRVKKALYYPLTRKELVEAFGNHPGVRPALHVLCERGEVLRDGDYYVVANRKRPIPFQ